MLAVINLLKGSNPGGKGAQGCLGSLSRSVNTRSTPGTASSLPGSSLPSGRPRSLYRHLGLSISMGVGFWGRLREDGVKVAGEEEEKAEDEGEEGADSDFTLGSTEPVVPEYTSLSGASCPSPASVSVPSSAYPSTFPVSTASFPPHPLPGYSPKSQSVSPSAKICTPVYPCALSA